jgi:hypothetical protein
VRFTQPAYKEDIGRVLDVDCILSPFIPLRDGAWPMALISNSAENSADLGSMESTGSLWKLARKVFTEYGVRGTTVVLQASEIGEKVRYLTPTLALTQDPAAAAIWVVKVQSASGGDVNILKPTTAFGTLVQLVLLPRNSDGSIDATDLESAGGQSRLKTLVAARASSGSGERGVAVLTDSERKASAGAFQWALTWQVTREDSSVDGFSFLDTVDFAV